jgi:hypothetical protein
MTRPFRALAFLLLVLFTVPAAAQQVPVVLNYQATLSQNGQRVEGTLPVAARVFEEETGGTLLWEELRSSVTIVDGRLSLLLGNVDPLPADLFDEAERYLEIEVDGEKMPRLRVASTPYALRAGRAQTAGRADVADAVAPGAAVTALSGEAGLNVSGMTGAVTLSIADGALTESKFETEAVSSRVIANDAVTADDIAPNAVGTSELDAADPIDGQVLGFSGTGLAWTDLPTASGDITAVTGEGGLSGGAPSGEATLSIANSGVTTAKIANGSVTESKLSATNPPGANQLLSYDGDNQFTWVDPASGGITDITTQDGLISDESGGSVTLGIADGGLSGSKLAGNALAEGANVSITRDGSGNIQVSVPNVLTSAVTSIEADGQTLDGNLTFAEGSGVSLNVNGNTVTFAADGSGGLTSVTTDGTLAGDGTSNSALGLAQNAVGTRELKAANPDDGQVLSFDGADLTWRDLPSASGDITAVTAGDGLSGGATSGEATLDIADGGVTTAKINNGSITESKLNATNNAGANQVLSHNGSNQFTWVDPVSGGITNITTEDGLTATESGGTVTLGIADGGLSGSKLSGNALAEGDNVSITRDSNDNIQVSVPNVLTSAVTSIEAGGQELDGNLTFAEGSGVSLSVSGSTVTFAADGSGGLTSVTTDGTLAGDGTSNSALGLDDGAVSAAKLSATTPTDGYRLVYDAGVAGNLAWEVVDGSLSSSIRFKEEVETIADASALVERLRGVRFRWTADGRPDIGLIAEEVAKVLPELVTYESDGTTVRGLRYAPLVAVLIEAAKTQQDALEAATQTVEAQRTELDALHDRVARLEALVESMHEASSTSTQ